MGDLLFVAGASISCSAALLLYCLIVRWSWSGQSSIPRGAFMVLIGLIGISTLGVVAQATSMGWNAVLGAMLCMAGAAIVEMTTRQRYWPAPFSELEPPGIDTYGLRGVIRHPTYLGIGFFSVGLFVAVPSLDTLLLLGVAVAWSRSAAYYEESQFLASPLRNEYREYQGRTSAFGFSKRTIDALVK